jgi:hypothetical protein
MPRSAPSETAPFVPPYPPSWFDRLTQWVDRLPGPAWAFYLTLALIIYIVETLVQWQSGTTPFGSFLPTHTAMAMAAFALGLGHYLKAYSGRAFDSYRPALLADEAEARMIRYRFTVMTRRGALLASIGGVAVGVAGTLANGIPFWQILNLATSPLSTLFNTLLGVATWATFLTVVYMILRQLRIVSTLFSSRTRVDLFGLEPLYALTGLTARAAVSFLAIPALFVILAPGIREQRAYLLVAVAASSIAGSTFLLPLLGIHRLLVAEKTLRLADQSRRMRAAIDDLHQRMDRRRLRQMDDLYKAMAGLDIERGMLSKIPTWPWEPGSIRGVGAAILLPLFLYVAQQILARVLGG